MSLQQETIQIIDDVLMLEGQVEHFNEDTGLLGSIPEFDSVAVVSLVTALEEEFGQEIPDEEAEKLQSVADVIKHVEESNGE